MTAPRTQPADLTAPGPTARERRNRMQAEAHRIQGLAYYVVTSAADWWLAQDDAAEVLRVETCG